MEKKASWIAIKQDVDLEFVAITQGARMGRTGLMGRKPRFVADGKLDALQEGGNEQKGSDLVK